MSTSTEVSRETEVEPFVYHLSAASLVATREKIEKLNARAAKRGLSGTLTVTATRQTETHKNALGFEITEVYWATEITGTAPKYAGWEFIATLDFDPAAGLITRCTPGFEGQIDRSKLRAGECDHCHTSRFRRNVYLLRHTTTGETRQVGSTCIKDFLGADVHPVFHTTHDIREELGYGTGGAFDDYDVTPETVLAIAWAAIEVFGFVRSREYSDIPTKTRVSQVLYPATRGTAAREDRELGEKLRPLAAKAAGQAKLIRDYILSDEFKGDSEYVINLKNLTAAERVGRRFFGLLASAPQAWARAVERDLRRQAERAEIKNEFFGEPKQRLELTVRIKSIRYWNGDYGTQTVYTLLTEDGHLAQWASTSGALGNEVTTTVYKIKATIKKHDEYKGTKYTWITRAAVLEEIQPEPGK